MMKGFLGPGRIWGGGGRGGYCKYRIPLGELYENSDYARSDSFVKIRIKYSL